MKSMPLATQKQHLKNILFIDIETASCVKDYNHLDKKLQLLWNQKAATFKAEAQEEARALFFKKAGIYAEFGKVITIGLGFITVDEKDELTLRVKALYGHDEKELLREFKGLLETRFPQNNLQLCAHNGKEFDFPYLCRRMLIHGISLPHVLAIQGKKPWEVAHLDTMEMWKFGDRKNFTSLDLLATLFGIASSKEQMEGNEVNHCYYVENDFDKITTYCMQDVVVTVQLFLKMNLLALIKKENIIVTH